MGFVFSCSTPARSRCFQRSQPRSAVHDPRTGKPLKFTYQQEGNDPESHAIHAALPMPVHSDYRKGDKAKLDSLAYLPLGNVRVVDLDTAKAFATVKEGAVVTVKLELPITDDKQSPHIRITGDVKDGSYKVANGELMFERTMRELRNTVLLPAGWDVTRVAQSGTIGTYENRAFVALINLNAENNYRVTIHARKR